VAATPHVISDVYPNTADGIRAGVEALSSALREVGLALEVLPAAEYYAESAFLTAIRRQDVISFGPEQFVLFESPVDTTPLLLEDIIYHLRSSGYTPLLAHAERYRFLQGNPRMVEHLKELGVRFQVNHPSFSLPKTSRTGEAARWLYIRGLVDALGTDMHRATPPLQPREDTRRGLRLFRQR
jgi:tyrosine-protein phosphatase YwqE